MIAGAVWPKRAAPIYFYRARYYDPVKGRFLQRDPLGYIDGLNLYAYVINNPINFTDSSGTTKCKEAIDAKLVISGVMKFVPEKEIKKAIDVVRDAACPNRGGGRLVSALTGFCRLAFDAVSANFKAILQAFLNAATATSPGIMVTYGANLAPVCAFTSDATDVRMRIITAVARIDVEQPPIPGRDLVPNTKCTKHEDPRRVCQEGIDDVTAFLSGSIDIDLAAGPFALRIPKIDLKNQLEVDFRARTEKCAIEKVSFSRR